jgi:hypothetical protein
VILLLTAGRVLAQDATPSPTPTATPPPEGSETLTAQISDGADDVNESAQTLTADAREVWIGNGDSLEGHYLGLRFQGVVIPRGSRILSAHLEFYTASDQWILVDVNIAAEASGDSLAFAPDNLPSQRALTQAVVHHQSDVLWPAETWQAFDEMAEVIQEVIDGPGWRSGHNLSVILNGAPTGSLFARKYVSAFEDAPVRAPRLAVLFLPPDAPDPTPTPAPTLTPSPTLTPTPAECNPDLPERLVVGQQGRVVFTAEGANTPLNVRAAPGTGGERLARLAASVTFEVVNGPVCADGLAWFEVEYGSPAERGWIAEGQGGRYFVEPVE